MSCPAQAVVLGVFAHDGAVKALGVAADFAAVENGHDKGRMESGLDVPGEICIGGRVYALSFEFKEAAPVVLLSTFREVTPKMGTVNFSNDRAGQLSVRSDNCLAILDTSQRIASIPVGTYLYRSAILDAGPAGKFRIDSQTGSSVTVREDEPAIIELGGVLNNSVEVIRRGRTLTFNYKLVDPCGFDYAPVKRAREAPTFAVYKGDKKVAGGTFPFG